MAPSNNTSRLIIIVISLLLASPREAWGQDMAFPVCQNRSRDQLESARQAVIGSLKRDNLYLTFVLDVSGSIDESWDEIKQFTLDLVNYAISEARVVIHADHTRVEVITFDDDARLRVFSSSGHYVDTCEFYDIMKNMSHHNRSASTDVHEALDAARLDILKKNRRVGGHAVLFLVSDGNFASSEKQVLDATSKLMRLGVQLFTVGVGKHNPNVTGLQWVAPEDDHYLCYHDWRQEFYAHKADNYHRCGDKNLLLGMIILGVVVVLSVLVTLLVLLARRQKRRQGVRVFNFFIFINFMTNGKLFKDAATSADTCKTAAAGDVPTASQVMTSPSAVTSATVLAVAAIRNLYEKPAVPTASQVMTSPSAVTSATVLAVAAIRNLYEKPAVPTEANVYEEIKTQMRDWDVHVRDLAADTDLDHVVIFDTKEEVMTCTEDFQLGACEVQHLQIVLTSGWRGETFQLAAKAYKITSIEQNAHVTAREISLSGEKAVVCVRTSGRFLVIGIGPEAAEASCMESVSTLLTELEVANDF